MYLSCKYEIKIEGYNTYMVGNDVVFGDSQEKNIYIYMVKGLKQARAKYKFIRQ